MRLSLTGKGNPAMVAELERRARAARNTNLALATAAEKLTQRAINHSSGRPGPNVISGAFIGAWTWNLTGGDSAEVSNPMPYAARLEYGFVGTDSLGRHYNQPPFPSLGTAVNESESLLYDELNQALFK